MFRIAICEDDPAQLSYLINNIERWAQQGQCRIRIQGYTGAEQLLFDYEDAGGFDLLVLDIQLENMNGMQLARKIREQDRAVKILFLTGLADYALEGYEVGAVRYLIKPVSLTLLESLLEDIRREVQQETADCFLFTANGQTCRIPYGKILYVEANGHYLQLVTPKERYEWKASFSSVAAQLESRGFFLLKRGLSVNLEYVSRISKTDCILETGELLPVSKNRYRELNEAFITYYKNQK